MNVEYCAEQRIQMLQERLKRCVCKYCGSELRLKRLIFHAEEGMRIEVFCQQCNRIEFGVENEIYLCAKSFVEDLGFNAYPELEQNETSRKMNIAKVCEIIAWADKKRGFLNENGFQVPIHLAEHLAGELLFVKEADVARFLEAGENDG